MPTVPAGSDRPAALRDVLTSLLDAVRGRPNRLGLPRMRSAAVVLVDGLGAEALAARAGHARTLAGRLVKGARIDTGCPTTTAAALASLTTGTDAGQHGLVGFTALDPAADRVVNQLHGFDDGTLPDEWQRSETVFDRARREGVRAVAIGPRHYATTGFTRAVLRGAEYLGARTLEARFAVLADVLRAGPAIAYLYVPELDSTAHAHGWESVRWTEQLEALDAAVAAGTAGLPADTGVLLTADHGILDVPVERRVLFDTLPGLLDGVRHVAGEPRCRHLHVEPDADADAVAGRWRAALGRSAEVVTRDEAITRGWYGTVDAAVAPRIGDVVVAASGRFAFFDGRTMKATGMVGQHGSWSSAERMVPLLRFGAAVR